MLCRHGFFLYSALLSGVVVNEDQLLKYVDCGIQRMKAHKLYSSTSLGMFSYASVCHVRNLLWYGIIFVVHLTIHSSSIFSGVDILQEVVSWREAHVSSAAQLASRLQLDLQRKKLPGVLSSYTADYHLALFTQNHLIDFIIPALSQPHNPTVNSLPESLTKLERQALHYFGGSLIRYLITTASSDPEIVEFLHGLTTSQSSSPNSTWTAAQDQHSLLYISSDFFTFLELVEFNIKQFIHTEGHALRNCTLVDLFSSSARADGKIHQQWSEISRALTSLASDHLFNKAIQKFCHVRAKAYVRFLNRQREGSGSASSSLRQSLTSI